MAIIRAVRYLAQINLKKNHSLILIIPIKSRSQLKLKIKFKNLLKAKILNYKNMIKIELVKYKKKYLLCRYMRIPMATLI